MLIALVNRADRLHEPARRVFELAASGALKNLAIASSALMEYELVLRARGYSEKSIREDLEAFSRLKGVRILPLTHETLLKAIELRIKHRLTYFDSLHAATALLHDSAIISADRAYKAVEGLTVLDLGALVNAGSTTVELNRTYGSGFARGKKRDRLSSRFTLLLLRVRSAFQLPVTDKPGRTQSC